MSFGLPNDSSHQSRKGPAQHGDRIHYSPKASASALEPQSLHHHRRGTVEVIDDKLCPGSAGLRACFGGSPGVLVGSIEQRLTASSTCKHATIMTWSLFGSRSAS